MSTIAESVTQWFKIYGHLNVTEHYVTRTCPVLSFKSYSRHG
jgi:hypothetical protein